MAFAESVGSRSDPGTGASKDVRPFATIGGADESSRLIEISVPLAKRCV